MVYIIKRFKLWLVLLLAMIIAPIAVMFALDNHEHTVKHLVYTEDYPVQYADELNQIFGDYKLGERAEKHVEGEDCSCGYHRDTLDFYEWQITYTDACGQEMQCTLNNHESLYYQQYAWLESQIERHIFDAGFLDALHCASKYLVIRIGNIISGSCNDEQWSHMETTEDYKQTLLHSSDILTLSSLKYSEIFDRFPIIIGGGIMLEHEGVSADKINANMTETELLVEDRISRLCSEIGENLNIEMLIYTNSSDPQVTQDIRFKYMLGTKLDSNMDLCDYEDAIYKSYIGKFW